MGYTTEFSGFITVDPPLNEAEIAYLTKFSETRRMKRAKGPYFVDGSGFMGQGSDRDVQDHNRPPDCQPGLWCHWVPSEDGTDIHWDGGEKFYDSAEWMEYIINHFFKPGAIAPLPFLQKNHKCNGVIKAQGEEMDDRWKLIVKDNKVTTKGLE